MLCKSIHECLATTTTTSSCWEKKSCTLQTAWKVLKLCPFVTSQSSLTNLGCLHHSLMPTRLPCVPCFGFGLWMHTHTHTHIKPYKSCWYFYQAARVYVEHQLASLLWTTCFNQISYKLACDLMSFFFFFFITFFIFFSSFICYCCFKHAI